LGELPAQPFNSNVIVGYEMADDAGVFRLRDGVALVQTVDFFTPIADDPLIFGSVAANNALNDVYAMGGKPLTALAILCYPQKGDFAVLKQILEGGQIAMNKAGVVILGGHSIDDSEIKFGYAVTGLVHPDQVITNANAKAGDVLVLTKPIGTGAISTAIKRGVASNLAIEAAMTVMQSSAAHASEVMQSVGVNSCTDITGFGLLGHAYEMARASDVYLEIDSSRVPLLPEVLELIAQGMLTRGDKNNRSYVGDTIDFAASVSSVMQSALFDPQTAGGLLISLKRDRALDLINQVENATIIGEVKTRADYLIRVL
jgi:selenide,water dikinase